MEVTLSTEFPVRKSEIYKVSRSSRPYITDNMGSLQIYTIIYTNKMADC